MRHKLGITLHEDEEPYAVLRAAGISYLFRIIFGMLWVLMPFLLFFPLLRFDGLGWGLFAVVALGGVLYLLNLRARWYGTAIVLTTKHCIDVSRTGIAPATVTTVRWNEIAALKVEKEQGVWRLFGLSRICVVLRQGAFDMELRGVRNGGEVRKLWDEVQCRV